MTLYFAYGSNMNRIQMMRRCPTSLYLGPSTLEGMRLDFGCHSFGRNGGVATLRKNSKETTPGILWILSTGDLEALDRAEAVPLLYNRIYVSVKWNGETLRAVTYKLQDFFKNAPHVDYWNIIHQVYNHHGWDTSNLKRTTPHQRAPRMNMESLLKKTQHQVFVYGSLRRGACNHGLLDQATFLRDTKTAPKYQLLDLGQFPAMIPGGSSIHGEVWQVDDEKLAYLDRFEGHPSFYRRELIQLEDGSKVHAYLLQDRPKRVPTVPSGDWVAYKYGEVP